MVQMSPGRTTPLFAQVEMLEIWVSSTAEGVLEGALEEEDAGIGIDIVIDADARFAKGALDIDAIGAPPI
jgi:hypothetical protein